MYCKYTTVCSYIYKLALFLLSSLEMHYTEVVSMAIVTTTLLNNFIVDFVKLVTVLQISAYVLVCSGQL